MKPPITLTIRECSPADEDVKPLLVALSYELAQITGNDGRASFSDTDVQEDRSVFLIAEANGEPVGCGGLRLLTEDICEVKRMYAKYRGLGIGREILNSLERYAQDFGYEAIWLETRKVNENAAQHNVPKNTGIMRLTLGTDRRACAPLRASSFLRQEYSA